MMQACVVCRAIFEPSPDGSDYLCSQKCAAVLDAAAARRQLEDLEVRKVSATTTGEFDVAGSEADKARAFFEGPPDSRPVADHRYMLLEAARVLEVASTLSDVKNAVHLLEVAGRLVKGFLQLNQPQSSERPPIQ